MKQAVDTVYKFLWLKQNDAEKYERALEFGNRYTRFWDEPKANVGQFWRSGRLSHDLREFAELV
jgi:hypothetical protein